MLSRGVRFSGDLVAPENVGGVFQGARLSTLGPFPLSKRTEGGKTPLIGAEPHDTGRPRGALALMPPMRPFSLAL